MMTANRRRILGLTPFCLASLAAVSAEAASLTKVAQSDWQGGVSLPAYVNMYIYVPDNRATKPPILVASHHCQGTGTTTFNETKSTFVSQADKNGYIIIFPEATGHNCWDVGSAKSLKHDGGGDTHAIAQMVKYAITKYSADATRVYAFGGSSGGMMTQALLGIYPDVFMAGVAVSGVPCGCWAQGYTGDVATNGQWSGPCAGGTVTKTAQAWGDLVRSMFPGYTGHRARVQLWHGDPDTTISFVNFTEAVKEWTNVLGLSATPTKTDAPNSSTTHQTWNSTCGFKVLETFAIKGAGHAVQWDLATASAFLGLDKVGGQDPETAACGGGTGGTTGAGGTTGTGGSASGGTASGGAATTIPKGAGGSSVGSGGTTARGGSNATGGSSIRQTTTARGGSSSTTVISSTGGSAGLGGSGGASTTSAVSIGGALSTAGAGSIGGAVSYGGAASVAGAVSTGGAIPTTSTASIGGTQGIGGSGAQATSEDVAESDGCSCSIPGGSSRKAGGPFAWLTLATLGMTLWRRRRTNAIGR